MWWNGGGKIKSRLESNPVLLKLINKTRADIFAYGEALLSSQLNVNLDGYWCYLHKAKPISVDNLRRGLAIFYLDKHKYRISKKYASKNFDFVLMRVEGAHEAVHLVFFYSPGAHHPLTVRKRFYDTFYLKFCEFATLGRVFLMGDTNILMIETFTAYIFQIQICHF